MNLKHFLFHNIWIKNKEKSSLFDLYKKEIKVNSISNQNITDKNLSNYGYIPIILEKIKGSKLFIHIEILLIMFYLFTDQILQVDSHTPPH